MNVSEFKVGEQNPSVLSFIDQDPFDFYEDLRKQGPILWDSGLKGWLLLTYDLVKFVESREDLFRIAYDNPSQETIEAKGGHTIALLTGEPHDRMRRFHMKLLSPKACEEYRADHVAPVVSWLIDRFAKRGSAELAKELAYQGPSRMIMSMLGLPWQDTDIMNRIIQGNGAVAEWIGRQNPVGEFQDRALDASRDLNELLRPYVQKRRGGGGDDFVSRIWREAPEDLGEIDENDVLTICRELVFAGGDTTVYALTGALYFLLTKADARAAVEKDRGAALNGFVDESFRLLPSAQWKFRVAVQDIEVAGVQVKANDPMINLKAAANRDPNRYPHPASMDLSRSRPSDYTTFNLGPRSCVGARLAKTEMREVVNGVLDRLPGLRLDPAAEQPRLRGVFMQSYEPLNVVFDPA